MFLPNLADDPWKPRRHSSQTSLDVPPRPRGVIGINLESAEYCDAAAIVGKTLPQVIVHLHEGGFPAYAAVSCAHSRTGLYITHIVSIEKLNKRIAVELAFEARRFQALEHNTFIRLGLRDGACVPVPDAEGDQYLAKEPINVSFDAELGPGSRAKRWRDDPDNGLQGHLMAPNNHEPPTVCDSNNIQGREVGDITVHEMPEKAGPSADENARHDLLIIEQLKDILHNEGPINLFNLIINPKDFGKSVKNLYYLSFLVRDGPCVLHIADNGETMVSAEPSAVNGAEMVPGRGQNVQAKISS
ncbi:hypothetical protein DFJ58DRAFT_736807 [Suillus subalutaceus]|uniref:uncharacterized protein n=1 Tax=Suillus subalutaceus TaxID=48586 RepID=UPI001B85C95A|nr:uncharacterized protein DFJ58DRAFT_736807 [Suillus subalutaceus]KAG1830953.1 hypothetical protein DFJ58DRAFT_736807 [Suillus subalutaceus]